MICKFLANFSPLRIVVYRIFAVVSQNACCIAQFDSCISCICTSLRLCIDVSQEVCQFFQHFFFCTIRLRVISSSEVEVVVYRVFAVVGQSQCCIGQFNLTIQVSVTLYTNVNSRCCNNCITVVSIYSTYKVLFSLCIRALRSCTLECDLRYIDVCCLTFCIDGNYRFNQICRIKFTIIFGEVETSILQYNRNLGYTSCGCATCCSCCCCCG